MRYMVVIYFGQVVAHQSGLTRQEAESLAEYYNSQRKTTRAEVDGYSVGATHDENGVAYEM